MATEVAHHRSFRLNLDAGSIPAASSSSHLTGNRVYGFAGALQERSFDEIWHGSPTLRWIRSLRNEDFAACATCDHAPYCRRSSGTMLTDTGNFTGPNRFGESARCVEAEIVHRLSSERSVPI